MNSPLLRAQDIKTAALSVGFHACGVAAVHRLDPMARRYGKWLERGGHADMDYLVRHADMRMDPRLLLPGARSVISVLLGYKPSQLMKGEAKVAQYAYGRDYHERVKKMLFQLMEVLSSICPEFEAKPCVDTVPISDKLWAREAGLGWIGKNTLLVNPELGSYCFIGELVTTSGVDVYDIPMTSRCGDCRNCLDCCPNGALVSVDDSFSEADSPTMLLAPRCTSYHTIENHDEQLPDELHRAGYAFGCDCCQLCCPFNQQALPRLEVSAERLTELEGLSQADESTFKSAVRHSAMNRIKYPQWRRNLDS